MLLERELWNLKLTAAVFNGRQKVRSILQVGKIIGTVNADNANESVITLTSADLIVDGNAHIVDQSAYSSQNRYAISAIGGVSVTMNDGRIESTDNTAVYINRLGSSGLQKDHAKFEMTGGNDQRRRVWLKSIPNLMKLPCQAEQFPVVRISRMFIWLGRKNSVSGTAKFTVKGNFRSHL